VSEISIQTGNRRNYISARDEGGGVADAHGEWVGGDEELRILRGPDGKVSFISKRGYILSAEKSGTLNFKRKFEPPAFPEGWQPQGWEGFTPVRGNGGEGLQTDHGTLVAARNEGGGELYHHSAPFGVAGDETFFPSVSFFGGSAGGGVSTGIVGRLRKQGRGLVDDRGWVLPLMCHSGTAIADLLYAPQDEAHNLDLITSTGYHGRRVWTRLRGTEPWSNNPRGWGGREFGHETMGERPYVDLLEASFQAHQQRGLKLVLSAGDIMGIDSEREIRRYVDLLCEALGRVSPDGSLCAIFESGNELPGIWRNGSPERARDWILKPFKKQFPHVLCTNSQGANEGHDERFRWCLDPADLDDIHSFRDNNWYDWIRHVINNQYRHEAGPGPRDIIWASEMFGTGGLVSVQPNKHQYDRDVAAIAILAHWMTGQIPCYFCSPGIRFDAARDFYGETYESMPGFSTVVADTAGLLPTDIMSWPRENIVHGGREDPPGSPNPVFEEPGSGVIDRAYHVFSDDHRRFAALIFGGESLDSRTYRAHSAEVDKRFGNKARLVVGQA